MPLTDAELNAQLDALAGGQEQRPAPLLTQSTQELANLAALESQRGTRNAPGDLGQNRERFLRGIGAEPGVAFHEEGLPTWDDLMVKARDNTEDQLRYLIKRFGKESVRLNERQEPVVRIVNPQTGQPEDYPVNPHQLTLNSITGLAALAPEIAMTGLAMRLGGKNPSMLSRALVGALGTEVGRGAKELGVEAASGEPLQVVDAIKRGIGNYPIDAALNLAGEAAAKGGQTVVGLAQGKGLPNPIANTKFMRPANPDITDEGVAAARRLQSFTGINPKLTAAEVTGIPVIAQTETYVGAQPAGTSPITKQIREREQAAKDIQNHLVDPATLGTDEAVGRSGLAVISKPVRDLETRIGQLQQQAGIAGSLDEVALQKARSDEITRQQLNLINDLGGVVPSNGTPKSDLGDALQRRALDLRAASEARYNAAYVRLNSFPEMDAVVIQEGGPLKKSIDATLAKLPKVEKTVEESSGLVAPVGRGLSAEPITTTATKNVPFSTPIRPRLEEISAKLSNGKVSLNDLKQLRTDVGNEITYGQAVTGTKDKRLLGLYAQISTAIEDGIDKTGNPALKQAWEDASNLFSEHATKFKEKNAAAFFREADQAGSLNQAGFVDKLLTNPDVYKAAKTFFGPNSQEYSGILNTARMNLLEKSLAGDNAVSGDKLVQALISMRKDNPALFTDAFGGNGSKLIEQANTLGTFQQRLPMDELAKLLASRNPVSQIALISLQKAEKDLAEQYKNQVVSRFLKGQIPAADLQPDQFVRFLPTAKLSDVQQVMATLQREAPDIADQISRKSIVSLLEEAKRFPTPSDTMAALKGEPGNIVSASGVKDALGTGDQLEKYKALLGWRYDRVIDFAKMETLRAEKERVGGGAGMLAKGQEIGSMQRAILGQGKGGFLSGMFGQLSNLAKIKAFAIILSHPTLSDFLLRPQKLSDMPATLKTIITSEPFIRGAIEEFGDLGHAYKAIATMRTALNRSGLSDADLNRQLDQLQQPNQPSQP